MAKEERKSLEVYTQVKLCENLKNIKACKTPTDWTIMALQSERTAKSHYVVVCKCPANSSFEGPFTHKHPPYARFPGIRVYGRFTAVDRVQTFECWSVYPLVLLPGMLCNQGVRKSKDPKGKKGFPLCFCSNKFGVCLCTVLEIDQNDQDFPEFPWELAYAVLNSTTQQGVW